MRFHQNLTWEIRWACDSWPSRQLRLPFRAAWRNSSNAFKNFGKISPGWQGLCFRGAGSHCGDKKSETDFRSVRLSDPLPLPNPRYLYNGCCNDDEHCIGVNTEEYVHTLLKDTLSLRAVCKKGILEFGKKDIWVPDLVGKMLPACNGISEQALGWKQIAAADGVHLVQSRYDKMAAAITVCVESLLNKSALPAVTSVSATPAQKTYILARIRLASGQCSTEKQADSVYEHSPRRRWKASRAPCECWAGPGKPVPATLLQYRRNWLHDEFEAFLVSISLFRATYSNSLFDTMLFH